MTFKLFLYSFFILLGLSCDQKEQPVKKSHVVAWGKNACLQFPNQKVACEKSCALGTTQSCERIKILDSQKTGNTASELGNIKKINVVSIEGLLFKDYVRVCETEDSAICMALVEKALRAKDLKMAYKILTFACKVGLGEACYKAATLFFGPQNKVKEYVMFLSKACSKKHFASCMELATYELRGGSIGNFEKWMEIACSPESVDFCLEGGRLAGYASFLKQQQYLYEKACKYSSKSCADLAQHYLNKKPTSLMAIKFLSISCKNEVFSDCIKIANIYLKRENPKQAEKWILKLVASKDLAVGNRGAFLLGTIERALNRLNIAKNYFFEGCYGPMETKHRDQACKLLAGVYRDLNKTSMMIKNYTIACLMGSKESCKIACDYKVPSIRCQHP